MKHPFTDIATTDLPALRDDSEPVFVARTDLRERIDRWASRLAGPRSLVFLLIPNTVDGVASLLGAWKAGHAVALLDPGLPADTVAALVSRYGPEYLISPSGGGRLDITTGPAGGPIGDETALLLSTSGSTGSPKFVRLSLTALHHNASAIADVLDVRGAETGFGHLPLHYSYGLSILTSHLVRGAPVTLTGHKMTDAAFWTVARDAKVAHFPGVPFHFQTMERLRYERLQLPDVRVFTQAGGNLPEPSRQRVHEYMDSRGGRFHVMYGQTEAGPRMTTLAHDDFDQAPLSVGKALPGGEIQIVGDSATGVAAGETGHVVYSGPNVMLGYAESRADLALGDVMGGRLETGDLGYLDSAGRLTLTGRAKRFGKVYGLRVDLDAVERMVSTITPAAVVQTGDFVHIFVTPKADDPNAIVDVLAGRYTLPRTTYRIHTLSEIPTTERGKIDYQGLAART